MVDNKTKIRVVIGINDFLVGGAQKLIVDQLKYFDYAKYDITLITLFSFPGHSDFYDALPVNTKLIKLKFRGFADTKSWRELYSCLKTLKPNVVISNLFFSNTVFRLLKILLNYKVIIVEHNTYINKPKWQILADKILSHLTFKIIAVSNTVAEFTSNQEKINRDKFEVINNGINFDDIKNKITSLDKSKLRRSLGLNQTSLVIINVARLTDQKNHNLLIDSFNEFLDIRPDSTLLILGEGSLRVRLENKIRNLGIGKNVNLLGSVTDVSKYYMASDFFVSTSKIEGFGIAHAEAMAYCLPVLSTRTAGPDEMVKEGENGYFVGNDIKSVVSGMIKIASSNLSLLGKNAYVSIQKYDIKNNVARYERLIES